MKEQNWTLNFRRWLDESNQSKLRRLRDILVSFPLNDEKDQPKWDWEKNGKFSVKSMYSHLSCDWVGDPCKKLWKANLPLKIKTFMWLVQQKAILTKENMTKRKWQGDTRCRFCPE